MFLRCFAYFDEGEDQAKIEVAGQQILFTRENPQIDVLEPQEVDSEHDNQPLA